MYAVIQTGGKQYKVQAGDIVQIEKLDGEVGTSLTFKEVLFASQPEGENSKTWIGKPLLAGASVTGEVVGQGRGDKVLIIKMKRRKQYRRTKGHRQEQTQVIITSVANGAGQTITLSDSDKKSKLSKFHTQLSPRGGLSAKAGTQATSDKAAPLTTKKAAPKKAAAAKKTTKASSSKE